MAERAVTEGIRATRDRSRGRVVWWDGDRQVGTRGSRSLVLCWRINSTSTCGHSAAADSPEQLYSLWQDAVARSRSALTEALANGNLDQRLRYAEWHDPASLRCILIDLIEEYARHVGHADLIRESVTRSSGRSRRGDGGHLVTGQHRCSL